MTSARKTETTTATESETAVVPTGGHHAACPRCVIGRRTALMGMGAVGLAGFLTACGDDEPADSADTPAPDAGEDDDGGNDDAGNGDTDRPEETEGTAEPEETAGPEPEQSPTGDGGEALAAVDDVPVGGGVILNGPGVVITQPSDGEFAAFSTVCTHQGCAVSEVADGLITCHCHGSQFSVADGSVERGPAEQALESVPIVVEGDRILPG
ncbi:Rieske (2Fe-2S) protein [Phytoactinopolyspora halotolerans]|uniref:Rieske (2Fe-2S) protein n=1 Tax=Phytoactinopolyspora halotolerans TaxID=1981512 RepID=UPI001C201E1F|nr:Rieske (2Fe-2S) protein [Phytoactinopolyspora halotolerans]